ncbi:Uu.00g055870.m01.CDS01 [Anthostomella pinea]|uniref:Mitochondrial intermembrane space import and assembly protein 40 n=1 Tax=Anthostomella pinea TaxID=933095 RepID=A0AAI8YMD2_9PEZI|nr:Uu.00g055870.m01.CDS01 [Anthostomella pinea]
MYRSALRSSPRLSNSLRRTGLAASGRRFASTSPADKKRSWKSSAVRWGLALGAVYWYSTSAAFAEEPQLKTIPPPPQFSDEDLPTVEAVVAQKRREAEARSQKSAAASVPEPATASLSAATSPTAPVQDVETTGQSHPPSPPLAEGSPEALEEEAGQQGAFNPETGEINWDCPCLGGMAHGPCGEEFKAAFSCFVYSNEEPKGMDCIDKFQHMQDCFRLHPEIYGEELEDDEQPTDGAPEAGIETSAAKTSTPEAEASSTAPETAKASAPEPVKSTRPTEEPKESGGESGDVIPKSAHDATSSSASKA